MSKIGYVATIPYQGKSYEVTGVEFCEWEDILLDSKGDENIKEQLTYEFLFENGYFVSKPKQIKIKKTKNGLTDGTDSVESPTDGKKDGKKDDNTVSGNHREPAWTPSKILAEKKKLIAEREKILKLKETAFDKKVKQARQTRTLNTGKHQTEPETLSSSDWMYAMIGLIFIIGLLGMFLKMAAFG